MRVLVATVPQSGERVEPGWIRRAGARPGTVSLKGRRDGEQSAFVFGSTTECPPMTGSRYGFIYRFFTLTCSALTGRLRGTRDASGLRGGTGDHRPADRPSTNQRRRPAELALGAGLPARPLSWSWRTSTARRSTRSSTRKDPLEQFTSNVTATTLAIHTTVVRVSERCAARSPRPRRRSGRRDRSIRDGAGRGHRLSRCSFPACSHEPDRALPSRTNQGLSRAHPGSDPHVRVTPIRDHPHTGALGELRPPACAANPSSRRPRQPAGRRVLRSAPICLVSGGRGSRCRARSGRPRGAR